MIHPVKTCDPCGAEFSPPPYLSEIQARATRSCSHACSAARSNGAGSGPGQTGRDIGDDGGSCVCEDCRRIRASDRTELISRYAVLRGYRVAKGPREAMTPSQLSARAARIRKARLENYDPCFSGDEDFEGVTI